MVRAVLPAILFLFLPSASDAQYVYLDTNGDGVWTTADRMNANGTPTTVDAWINTNHNRDGSLATCNMADGDLGFWNSYAVNLKASAGTVTFTNFVNRQSNFDLTCVGVGIDFATAGDEMTACRATATSEAGGLKKMFTVTVTGQSGTPWLRFLPLGTLSPNFTSFGTPCSGNDFDNTYKLGSDFFDNDGAGPFGTASLPPIINAPINVGGVSGSLVTIASSASDPDAADLVTLSQTNNAPFLAGPASAGPSANPSISLSGTPNSTQAGSYAVNWSAHDNFSTPNSATFTTSITIANTTRNPVVTAPATASGIENTWIRFTVTASDPDGYAILSLGGSPLPGGSSFTPNAAKTSGTFSWTPSFTQAGSYGVTWTATDAIGGSGTAATTVTVNNVDRAPTVTAPATASFASSVAGTVTVTASDPDGQAITSLTEASSPATTGSTFTAGAGKTSGTFSWTPSLAQAGTYTLTFTASNALSGTAATNLHVTTGANPPIVVAPATQSGTEYTNLSFSVSASDPDGEALTKLYPAGRPSGATFSANAANTAGTFSWTPLAGQAGTYNVQFIAENALVGSAQTAITIAPGSPIGAPFMFMDTDGDGVFSEADRLKPNGTPTTVDVWVSTLRTPTGAATVCNTLDGSLGTWNSYVANIAVSGGTVTFGTPTNSQLTFNIPVVPFAANDTEMAYGQAGLPITAGLQRMFTMEVTGLSGDPSLSFMPVGHFVPSPTSFGTPCSGLDYDNTYKLGTDWFEAFGALPSSAPPSANLVGNPSFESSTAGWAGLDGATIQRVEGGHDGGYSLEVRGPAGSTGKFSVNDSPNWVEAAPAAGTVYQFSAWVRAATVAGNAQLRVRQYLNRVHQGTWYSPLVKLGPTWQRVTLDVSAVAAGATLDLQVMDAPLAGGEVFQTDDISIRIGASTPSNLVGNPSFESSTAGWAGLDGAIIQRVEGGHTGGYSLEVQGPSGSTAKFSVNDSPNWVESAPAAGTVYQFSAFVRSATVAGNAQLRVRQYVNRIHQGTWYSPTVKLGPAWQRVTMGVPAVAAGATLDLQVMDAPVAAGEVFQTDDISIQILPSGSAASFASFESVESVEMEAVMAPNPLNPEAVLSFTTREAGPIQVHIYSATGRHVRTLSASSTFPGRQAVRFNGVDASGRRLASGVYFYRIEAGSSRATGRFVVLK